MEQEFSKSVKELKKRRKLIILKVKVLSTDNYNNNNKPGLWL